MNATSNHFKIILILLYKYGMHICQKRTGSYCREPVNQGRDRPQTVDEMNLFETGLVDHAEDLERELMADFVSKKGRRANHTTHKEESPIKMIYVFELEEAG